MGCSNDLSSKRKLMVYNHEIESSRAGASRSQAKRRTKRIDLHRPDYQGATSNQKGANTSRPANFTCAQMTYTPAVGMVILK